jgi:hypothetical protein
MRSADAMGKIVYCLPIMSGGNYMVRLYLRAPKS